MATGNITKRAVEAFQSDKGTAFLWDAGEGSMKGFGLRVTATGVKSYVYQYRIGGRGGKVVRYKIGRHGVWTPDAARKRARELASLVASGVDPLAFERAEFARRQEAEREAAALAFDDYSARYLKAYVRPEIPDSFAFVDGIFRNHARPVLGRKPLPEITRRDIARLIDGIPPERQSVRRNAFAVLRKLFNWAKARGDLDRSPMEGMDPPASVASRDRVLSDTELALAMRAAQSLPAPIGPMFEVLFLTGQRRDEVASMRWEELDRATALWTLPRARTKNGEANLVPLSSMTLAALDRAASQLGDSPQWPLSGFVFTTTGFAPVSGHSKAKGKLDAAMLAIAAHDAQEASQEPPEAIAHWRLHDARRTLATGLQRLGVRFEVTEAVLNHVSGSRSGVAGVYQRHGWGPEKRAALDAWAAHIAALLSPSLDRSNVVELRANTGKG